MEARGKGIRSVAVPKGEDGWMDERWIEGREAQGELEKGAGRVLDEVFDYGRRSSFSEDIRRILCCHNTSPWETEDRKQWL